MPGVSLLTIPTASHWLHLQPLHILKSLQAQYEAIGDAPAQSLIIRIFIFRGDNNAELLVQRDRKTGISSVPTQHLFKRRDNHGNTQLFDSKHFQKLTLRDYVLRVFQPAIKNGALPGLQMLDFAFDRAATCRVHTPPGVFGQKAWEIALVLSVNQTVQKPCQWPSILGHHEMRWLELGRVSQELSSDVLLAKTLRTRAFVWRIKCLTQPKRILSDLLKGHPEQLMTWLEQMLDNVVRIRTVVECGGFPPDGKEWDRIAICRSKEGSHDGSLVLTKLSKLEIRWYPGARLNCHGYDLEVLAIRDARGLYDWGPVLFSYTMRKCVSNGGRLNAWWLESLVQWRVPRKEVSRMRSDTWPLGQKTHFLVNPQTRLMWHDSISTARRQSSSL